MKRRPQYFLLGAPKCGTTALASYLADHPLIYVSKPKEPHYFCKDLKAGGIPVKSDEEYLDAFFQGLDESEALVAIDCSVWYLYSAVAVKEILRFEPDAKFLVMLRNPVKMVWSLYSMLTFQGQEDQRDFMSAWQLQEARQKGSNLPPGLWLDKKMLLYRDVCALGSQLKRVLNSIDPSRVHIELQDNLNKDTQSVYLRVLQFMGVPDDIRTEFKKENTGRKIKSPLVYNFLRSQPVMSVVVAAKKALGLKTLGFGRPDLPLPEDIGSFLSEQFEDEVRMLENLLNTNLANWRYGH